MVQHNTHTAESIVVLAVAVVAVLGATSPALAAGGSVEATAPATAAPGETVTVEYTVENTGEEASSYILDVTLPDDVTVEDRDATAGGTWKSSGGGWLWQTLEPGQRVQATLTLRIHQSDDDQVLVPAVLETNEGVEATSRTIVSVSDGSTDGGSQGANGGSGDDGTSDGDGSDDSGATGADGGDGGAADDTATAAETSTQTDASSGSTGDGPQTADKQTDDDPDTATSASEGSTGESRDDAVGGAANPPTNGGSAGGLLPVEPDPLPTVSGLAVLFGAALVARRSA